MSRKEIPTGIRQLPIKLQSYCLKMFSCLIVHHLSLPSLGISKCSRQVEKRVFILSTTNLLPQDHDAVTKHSLTLSFCLWSGEKASPPFGQAGLFGSSLRSSRKKTFWCYGGHCSSWTNYLFEASVWAPSPKILSVLLEKHKPEGVYWRISYLLPRLSTHH